MREINVPLRATDPYDARRRSFPVAAAASASSGMEPQRAEREALA